MTAGEQDRLDDIGKKLNGMRVEAASDRLDIKKQLSANSAKALIPFIGAAVVIASALVALAREVSHNTANIERNSIEAESTGHRLERIEDKLDRLIERTK